MPLCFLTPSGSGVLTHPRQADQAICFPGLCSQERCSFLQILLQNPSVRTKASLWCSLPMGLVRTVGTARPGMGTAHPGMGTAHPAKPPLLLARVLPCRHLQHFPSFLLTPRPSAEGGFAASFQQDHSVPTDDSAPPSKASCFTPTPVLLRIFLVRHLCSLPLLIPMYSQTFAVGFFLIKLRSHGP